MEEEEDCFEPRIQFTFVTWNNVCTPYCGVAVCVFSSCPSIKVRWPSVWVRTYLVVREETECLFCFFSCVRTPWSACVQTVVLTGPGLDKINSESLQIHYTCFCLGRYLLLQHPGVDHNYVNQVIENSKLPFFGSHLSEKSPCIAVEQVNILDVATIHRHNCWSWYFYMILLLPIILPHLWFGQFTNKQKWDELCCLYLNITAETFTESKCLAYSCKKPCGFFFKFCPVRNLNFLFKQIHSKNQCCVISIVT